MKRVEYNNKSRKTYLRGKVKEFVLCFTNMSKPFLANGYADKMYPIIKGCRKHMNKDVLPQLGIAAWMLTTTQHVVQSIFVDTHWNEDSKERSVAKRMVERESVVSLKPESRHTHASLLS